MFQRRLRQLPAALAVAAGLILPAGAGAALTMPPSGGIPNQPGNQPNKPGNQPTLPNQPVLPARPGSVKQVLKVARIHLARRVSERRGNNVPRYRNGKGRIAPYSISDQWCVAFATWVWNRAGFLDYLGTRYIWRSHDGTPVAVQVTDMSRWARRNAHWSARAKPGYLVAYNFSHIGIVTKVNRNGRAVAAIEGNKSNRVRKVRVPMASVTGYISPSALTASQIKNAIANPDMPVPDPIASDPDAFARASTAGH